MKNPALNVKTLLSCLLVYIYSTVMAHCKQVNITVDDTLGDPTTGGSVSYTPSGAWTNPLSCPSCDGQPDQTKTTNGTWHASTFDSSLTLDGSSNAPLNASISFTGMTVEVYCVTSPDSGTDVQIFLDSVHVSDFTQSQGSEYQYDVLVYANQSLPNASHTLVLQNGRPGGSVSRAILDRIVYSQNAGASAPASSSGAGPNTGAVVGGVLGGTALVALLAFFAFFGARSRNLPRVKRFTVEITGAYSTFQETTLKPSVEEDKLTTLRVNTNLTPSSRASPPWSATSRYTPPSHSYPPSSPTGRSPTSVSTAASHAPLLPQLLSAAYVSPTSTHPQSIGTSRALPSIPNPNMTLKPNRRIGPDMV